MAAYIIISYCGKGVTESTWELLSGVLSYTPLINDIHFGTHIGKTNALRFQKEFIKTIFYQ